MRAGRTAEIRTLRLSGAKEGRMKEYIVSTQDEYDKAIKDIGLSRKHPFYDIERDKGTELVEEVDYLMYHYLHHDVDTEMVYDDLSRLDFDQSQMDAIITYFKENPPRDLFDVERALNRLHAIPSGYESEEHDDATKLIIKDSREKIVVRSDVEVYGNSCVEAFEKAAIIAKHNAYVIAHDEVSVEARHKTRVDAHDHSQIRAYNNVLVIASGESQVMAYHGSFVRATEKAEVSACHGAYIRSMDEAKVAAYDKSIVYTRGNSAVNAFNNSHIIAFGMSLVTAHDQSYIHAFEKSKIEARNQSCVLARENALVAGYDDSIIFTRGNARSTTSGKSFSIDEKQNTAENLRNNMLAVMRRPRFAKDPILAVHMLMKAVPEENRAAINKKLLSLGCNDAARTKNILSRWVKGPGEDISYER
jgi:hypothetical protein